MELGWGTRVRVLTGLISVSLRIVGMSSIKIDIFGMSDEFYVIGVLPRGVTSSFIDLIGSIHN